MYDMKFIAPKKRSRLRVLIGRQVYTALRFLQWNFSSIKYAQTKSKNLFPYKAVSHKSPVYRKLKDISKWLQDNKKINLQLAINSIDGLVIHPGETFSYWKTIGSPLNRRGFVPGMILINGKPSVYPGGGLCQLSNLIYWMTIHTPLTVSERFRHSYDVFPDSERTQPFGSGATCVYNYRDLQIRNDENEPYQLKLAIKDDFLEGEWRTQSQPQFRYEVYEKKHWLSQALAGVYIRNNILHRRYFFNNDVVDDQYIAENHARRMYSPLLEAPTSFSQSRDQTDD